MIGLEIEFNCDRDEIERVGPPPGWLAHYDSSCGGELISPPMRQSQVASEVEKAVRCIRSYGFDADRSCGIHVHLTNPPPRRLIDLMDLWVAWEPEIVSIVKTHRGRLLETCRPVNNNEELIMRLNRFESTSMYEDNITMRDIAWIVGGDPTLHEQYRSVKYVADRYYTLNMCSTWLHGTVEFRLFNGTLDPERIVAYAKIATAVNAAARAIREEYQVRPRRAIESTSPYSWPSSPVPDELSATKYLTKKLGAKVIGAAMGG